jgi:5-methylcytosine-specific restriction endonuclease McrA
MSTLQHAKDLLSHVLPEANWADVITVLAEKHVKKVMGKEKATETSINIAMENKMASTKHTSKKDQPRPVQKKLAAEPKIMTPLTEQASSKLTSRFFTKQERKHLKITTKRQLLIAANHRCEFQSAKTGRKCQSTYQLQSDHRIPLALGGSNEIQNFRVICRTHNLLEARKLGLNR